MATWQRLVALTFIGASLISACEISTGDDEDNDSVFDDDDDNVAGSGNRAGQATAGRAGSGTGGVAGSGAGGRGGTGGRAGSGGTATAGTGNSAGDDGIPDDLTCGDGQGKDPWSGSCDFADGFDARYDSCLSCLGNSCCDELRQCYATNPSTSCGYGGVDGQPEYLCFIECIVAVIDEVGFYDDDDEAQCAFDCGTAQDGQGRACTSVIIADSTNALLGCMHDNCEADCVEDLAKN